MRILLVSLLNEIQPSWYTPEHHCITTKSRNKVRCRNLKPTHLSRESPREIQSATSVQSQAGRWSTLGGAKPAPAFKMRGMFQCLKSWSSICLIELSSFWSWPYIIMRTSMFLLKCAAPPPRPWTIKIGVASFGLQCFDRSRTMQNRNGHHSTICLIIKKIIKSDRAQTR
jgi:hypothetical protein